MEATRENNSPTVNALEPTVVEDGLYVLGNIYKDVDGGYFAESPLSSGILHNKREE